MKNWNESEVLLVEDNPTDAELCLEVFAEHNLGNNIVWVKDGVEALDYLYHRAKHSGLKPGTHPKAVLLDLRLPKVDGLEVLRTIKGDETLKLIPVVVLTSSKEDRDIVESYKLGVNSYIQKPVAFEDFAREIARVGLYWLIANKVPG